MSEDGRLYLTPDGKVLLDSAGRRILRATNVMPCCCPDNACTASDTICPCNETGGGAVAVLCCQNTEGTVTITWPTITAAAGISGETYGAVIQDFITTASGSAMVLDGPGLSGNQADAATSGVYALVYAKNGGVLKIDCCEAFTWRVRLTRQLSYPDVVYFVTVDVIKTDNGGYLSVGDAFPCTSKDWSSVLTVAATSSAADGDCDGPTENIDVDNIDADYIDDASLSVSSGDYSDTCSYANWSEFPADYFIDLTQFYAPIPAGIATATFSFVPANVITPVGSTGSVPYTGTSGGFVTDGVYRVSWEGFADIVVESALDPDSPCPNSCCWGLTISLFVEEFIGGSWTTVYAIAGTTYIICPRDNVAGTYALASGTGPATIDVTI